MSCDRSRQIELADFLDDPRAASFRNFRGHYPRCAECSAEVRAWTELHQALQPNHPDPEQLAQYASLEPQQRARIDLHAARCPSCREELSELGRFDPALLLSGAAATSDAAGWLGRFGEFMQGLRRLLWQPAFAYAIAALLLLPVVYRSPLLRDEHVVYEIMTEQAPPSAREAMLREEPEAMLREERETIARGKTGSFATLAPGDERVVHSDPQSSLPQPAGAGSAGPAQKKAIAPTLDVLSRRELAKAKRADAELPLEVARSPQPAADFRSRSSQLAPLAGMAFEADALFDGDLAEGAGAVPNERLDDSKRESSDESTVGPGRAGARDLVLRSDTLQTVRLARGEALWLRIPVGFEAGEAELRVADASHRRELRERVLLAGPPGRREARLRLPGSWLTPGRYSVLVVSAERAAAGESPERFAFTVERR
ncbi:MAG: hypothetical protein E2O69_09985 [Deltaproteobacteria bacterium]|nr:MAG: hypothetical protein E2O69_09985 [Deltaproteobacteria bacterium]